ncbi:hypothetical protein [Candidatus Symbiobacter mobilis]|uniref:Uncharacterized protein n=1 Tax=Candidatus Symbiobacter mobilis CR TaxID=946483 RepID=U5NCS3_9BURK|nr:hypothetical protein [Candidatus Symbiobacter mobilis]AGX88038.1 hypothetical protein Cenrod_1962 [Candidatus Symbiobacter mobilis CR]
MDITIEDIKEHIPYYLTQEAKEGLIKALKDFPEKMNYYTARHPGGLLQGDGWNSLDIINIETAERKSIKGIILSNSCDISQENTRDLPARIVFAPIFPLSLYESLLAQSGIDPNKVSSKISSIKLQKVTSLFYLPKGGYLESNYIAVLDDLHTLPVQIFDKKPKREKQFTLSQAGFYLFLFKLSIHFCRFHENVFRDYEQLQTTYRVGNGF